MRRTLAVSWVGLTEFLGTEFNYASSPFCYHIFYSLRSGVWSLCTFVRGRTGRTHSTFCKARNSRSWAGSHIDFRWPHCLDFSSETSGTCMAGLKSMAIILVIPRRRDGDIGFRPSLDGGFFLDCGTGPFPRLADGGDWMLHCHATW